MEYIPTIGLEIHAELKTASKMFCGCHNDPDNAAPNTHICPVCMGHPGTLPVINKEAVRHVLRMGIALKGTLADYTEFDRKNYFYPDLPRGYQISQYKYPLVSGGELNGVAITRVHLEEDTARSSHDPKTDATLVDFNRACVPLMELVTEPVMHTAKQVGDFARELQLVLRCLGAGEANMEKGQMRVEANISVSNSDTLGTKVEVKNLNSFRSVERAVEFEISRQTEMLKKGEKITQETRGWDENKEVTFSQRVKEGSADYRYFPDPDLPHLVLSEIPEFARDVLETTIPELPVARRERYTALGLRSEDVELYVREQHLADFFDAAIASCRSNTEQITRTANYISTDLQKLVRDGDGSTEVNGEIADITIKPERFAELMVMVGEGAVSSRGAKDLLPLMLTDDRSPRDIAKEKGMLQSNDEGALLAIVDGLIAEHTAVVAEYKAGKVQALQFLIGQGMKAAKGSGNPGIIKELLVKRLG